MVAQEEALDKCIYVTPNRLAVEQRAFCEQLLTLRDLKEAVFSMAEDKSPGCDGFLCEFHKHLWEHIGPDLHKVYLESYHSKSLGAIINKGNIKFIPKAGDPEDICIWRPITLLNVSYKIITMAISHKIRHLLPSIVRPEKNGFIKSRYILDNIIVVWEGMEWARKSKQPAIFLEIDFVKAYDRIAWPFILAMLQDLGFGPKFLQSMEILFGDANACITISNSQSGAFGIFHSIRQGFPLAPSLYVLVVEGFGYLLAHSISSRLVRGISLQESSSQLVNGHFVDDSFLTLLEDQENINNALNYLDTFCQASGSAIQWHKMLCYS